MDRTEQQSGSPRLCDGSLPRGYRSPDLAFVEITTNLLRKNEREHTDDELSDEEAEAFGYC